MPSESTNRRLSSLSYERRTQVAFIHSGDYAHISIEIDGTIVDWNPAASKLLGWAETEVQGQHISIIFTPEDIALGAPEMERSIAAVQGVAADERWHLRRDGTTFWAIGQITALYDNDEIVGFAKILRDRTRERTTEEHLRIAQQVGGLGTFEYFPATDLVVTSEQFCQLWNIPIRDQYSVSQLTQYLHPDDKADFFSLSESPAEARLIAPLNSNPKWIARRGKAFNSDPKRPPRFAGVCYDIDDLKRADYDLREALTRLQAREKRFRQLAEFAPGITWLSDTDGKLTYLNNQWHQYSGQTLEEALHDGWAAALHPLDVSKVSAAWSTALQQGTRYEVEARFRRRDGMYRWYLIRAEPLYSPDEQVTGWFGSSIDIHDRMMAEAALRLTEHRQKVLLDFDEAIRPYSDPDDIKQASCGFMLNCLQLQIAGYGRVNQDSDSVTAEVWIANEASVLRDRMKTESLLPDGISALNKGRTYVFEDDSRRDCACAVEGILEGFLKATPSRVIVPFVDNGYAHSVLFFGDQAKRAWEPEDIALIEEVARKICHAIDKAHSAKEFQRKVQEIVNERDQIWKTSPDLLVVLDFNGKLLSASPAVRTILGWTEEEIVQHDLKDLIHRDDLNSTYEEIGRHLQPGYITRRFVIRSRHRDGTYRWLSWTASSANGRVYAIARDITDIRAQSEILRKVEDELRQSQKMEAVGRLTGGIAHDFNNHLQGISGSLELMRHLLHTGRTAGIEKYLDLAAKSTEKASALTHRLLAFSRRQPLDPRPIDVNKLINSLEDLLRRTMGENVRLELRPSATTWLAHADSNQLENALLNLAINARDAMPDGGVLTIETENAKYDEQSPSQHSYIEAGEYAVISISDEGIGMTKEVMAHVFEPFFTTKPLGKGTGLGLSMVYGFVKQSKGAVTIDSRLGAGTTVQLFLPRHIGSDMEARKEASFESLRQAATVKKIVIVEDDAVVRDVICDALQALNYDVFPAIDAKQALEHLESTGSIDLLITDIVLPDISGVQLVESIRSRRPEMKVLFMTGYAEHAANKSEFLRPGYELITKPFSLQGLTARLKKILG